MSSELRSQAYVLKSLGPKTIYGVLNTRMKTELEGTRANELLTKNSSEQKQNQNLCKWKIEGKKDLKGYYVGQISWVNLFLTYFKAIM